LHDALVSHRNSSYKWKSSKQFCNTELRALSKAHDQLDIRMPACHPESNGIVERFNGTMR